MKMALKRKIINYKHGDFVYLKNHSPDKVDPKWIGSFQIVRVSDTGNNVYIKKENKILRTSINNVFSFRREQDAAYAESATTKDDSKNIQNLEKYETDKNQETGSGPNKMFYFPF
ncbi:hypothetical protein EQH57_0052 [Dictyocoela roeselum]|nr:hypothetical protein EQH57_0052 [Dictyocoela roeselum]